MKIIPIQYRQDSDPSDDESEIKWYMMLNTDESCEPKICEQNISTIRQNL